MVSDLELRPGPPWWMAPYAISLLVLVPLLTAAWLVPVEFHWDLDRFGKFMTFGFYVLGLGGAIAFAGGAYLSAHSKGGAALTVSEVAASPALARLLRQATWTTLIITVAAYAIWFMPVARDPSILISIVAGGWYQLDIRDNIGTIPGVTTLVQAQVVYVTLLVLRWLYVPTAQPSTLEKAGLVFVFFLAVFRNFVWSERIAVIEFMVPLAILFLRKPRFPLATALMPLFGVAGLFLFFSVFEYFRSWSAYYQNQYDSFWVFVLARLSGYYVTALDNGAGLVRDWGGLAAPYSTLEWFWKFPIEIGQTFLSQAFGFDVHDHTTWLYWNASQEFNNDSGIYMPFVDYGRAGGLIFWFLFGLLTGRLYRGFMRGTFAGMLIYPSWFIGMLELPRILYLFEARYFPVLLIALALIWMISAISTRARAPVPRIAG